jgi:hypothetical protein
MLINVGQLPLDNFFGDSTELVKDIRESQAEDPVYERKDVIHSVNCQELIGCHCTPAAESQKLAAEYEEKIKRKHAGRNKRLRERKTNDGTQQQEQAIAKQDHWDPTEDFE